MFSWIVFFKKIWSNTIYLNYRGKDQSKGLGRFLFTKIIHWKNSFWCNFYLMPINLVTVLSNKRLFQSLSKNAIVFKCIIDHYACDASRIKYLTVRQWDNFGRESDWLVLLGVFNQRTKYLTISFRVKGWCAMYYTSLSFTIPIKSDEFHFLYAIDCKGQLKISVYRTT